MCKQYKQNLITIKAISYNQIFSQLIHLKTEFFSISNNICKKSNKNHYFHQFKKI